MSFVPEYVHVCSHAYMYFDGGSGVFECAIDRFLLLSCSCLCTAIVDSLYVTFLLLWRQGINWNVHDLSYCGFPI